MRLEESLGETGFAQRPYSTSPRNTWLIVYDAPARVFYIAEEESHYYVRPLEDWEMPKTQKRYDWEPL